MANKEKKKKEEKANRHRSKRFCPWSACLQLQQTLTKITERENRSEDEDEAEEISIDEIDRARRDGTNHHIPSLEALLIIRVSE